MKTTTLEIPTMRNRQEMQEVSLVLLQLSVQLSDAAKGRIKVTFGSLLKKVDIIIALEEAGFIVKY